MCYCRLAASEGRSQKVKRRETLHAYKYPKIPRSLRITIGMHIIRSREWSARNLIPISPHNAQIAGWKLLDQHLLHNTGAGNNNSAATAIFSLYDVIHGAARINHPIYTN